VDARQLNAFRAETQAKLLHARVQRVVCVVHGLILELQGAKAVELGLLSAPGVARVYCFEQGVRDDVHRMLRAAAANLVAPFPQPPAHWPRDASALDALRAWLLRPAAQPPEWMQLEGARLSSMRSQELDRRLWLEFEKRDDLGRSERLVLVAELFDRGANFILRSDSEAGIAKEIANWKGRRPAPEKRVEPSAPRLDDTQPHDSARQHDTANAAEPWGLVPTLLQLATASARELLSVHARAHRRHEKRLRTRVKKLEADAQRAEQAKSWRRMGEALAAHLSRVRRGQQGVTLDDPYAPGTTLEIQLDPRLSPQENVALLFKRARRGERGRDTIVSRLTEARRELDLLTRSAAPGPEPLDWPTVLHEARTTWAASLSEALARADAATLWAPGGPRWERPPEPLDNARRTATDDGPGRRFTLPGKWEVRVGRSNQENDELTHRFARPDDVWLHASGVPGSHVVLRMKGLRDNPPSDVLKAAAAIAARFSRAKHARTVPVIWTRKRYVRKPRKSKPGLATCTQEKTIFVQPGLPAGEHDSET
jgi:predicted ribosome quality control (RQC) complex YloA/Tae2 family protein